MRSFARLFFAVTLLIAAASLVGIAQTSDQTPLLNPTANKPAQNAAPVDPYKPVLDKLESLSTSPLPEWRWHADVPHPEDARINDSDWIIMKPEPRAESSVWKTGTRVFRRMVEVPEQVNGYSTA